MKTIENVLKLLVSFIPVTPAKENITEKLNIGTLHIASQTNYPNKTKNRCEILLSLARSRTQVRFSVSKERNTGEKNPKWRLGEKKNNNDPEAFIQTHTSYSLH